MRASLQRKGFTASDGDHVFLTYVTTSGLRTTITTKISHGGGHDIGEPLLAQMARQCRLTKPLFLLLVDCPLDRNGYEVELKSKGALA